LAAYFITWAELKFLEIKVFSTFIYCFCVPSVYYVYVCVVLLCSNHIFMYASQQSVIAIHGMIGCTDFDEVYYCSEPLLKMC
jgi:hypothetical protein